MVDPQRMNVSMSVWMNVLYKKLNKQKPLTILLFMISVADPDPHRYAFILVGWIRIRIGNTDPDPGGPKWNKKSEENSSFEVLDILFWGMKTSPVAGRPLWRHRDCKLQILIQKIKKFSDVIFFQFLVIRIRIGKNAGSGSATLLLIQFSVSQIYLCVC